MTLNPAKQLQSPRRMNKQNKVKKPPVVINANVPNLVLPEGRIKK